MQRALALHFAGNALTLAQRSIADAFMWGPSFLVAPVVSQATPLCSNLIAPPRTPGTGPQADLNCQDDRCKQLCWILKGRIVPLGHGNWGRRLVGTR